MTESVQKLSEGLLAHLHLSHAQAAVMVDDLSHPKRLMVHIYDERAAKGVKSIRMWKGLTVRFVTSGIQPQH